MNTTQVVLREEGYCDKEVLYMALELSHKTWRLVFSDGGKERQVSIEVRDALGGGDREGEGEVWVARGGGGEELL